MSTLECRIRSLGDTFEVKVYTKHGRCIDNFECHKITADETTYFYLDEQIMGVKDAEQTRTSGSTGDGNKLRAKASRT